MKDDMTDQGTGGSSRYNRGKSPEPEVGCTSEGRVAGLIYHYQTLVKAHGPGNRFPNPAAIPSWEGYKLASGLDPTLPPPPLLKTSEQIAKDWATNPQPFGQIQK